jgi:dienelactone hydrolase
MKFLLVTMVVSAGLMVNLSGCGNVAVKQGNTPVANRTPSETAPATGPSTVKIESPDGVVLVGSFYRAQKPNSPAILLLHQWMANRHTFDRFAERMNKVGFAVLAIDGRGFGESVRTADGKELKVDTEKGADPKDLLSDVNSAIEFLGKQENVNANKIGIIGASYGSSVSIMYAAEHPNIAAVVLLSPGVNYFDNLPTLPAIKKYAPRPILLVAAEDDKDSAADSRKLKEASADPKAEIKIYPSGGHGTALFDLKDPNNNNAEPLAELIEKFLESALVSGGSAK